MTYSLHLHTCNLGTTSRTYNNPFTDELIEVPNDIGLSVAERANVKTLLEDMRASDPDPDGWRKVNCVDGGIVNVDIGTLEDAGRPCIAIAAEFECLTPDVASFIFDVARFGNLSVGSTFRDVVLLTKAAQNELVAKRWPNADVATTLTQLESWLEKRIMANHEEVRDRIVKAADILVRQGVATENTICGCSAKEIEDVESDVGRTLPLAYREFLAKMGRGAGAFFVGTDCFYPSVLGNTEAAHELVAEDKAGLVLPEDAIAFSMHQGYQFMFVRVDEGDDPPVYYYMEQSGEFVKKAEKLTQFLIDVAHDDW